MDTAPFMLVSKRYPAMTRFSELKVRLASDPAEGVASNSPICEVVGWMPVPPGKSALSQLRVVFVAMEVVSALMAFCAQALDRLAPSSRRHKQRRFSKT